MATITASQAISGVQPKGNHNGVDAVVSSINMGTGFPGSLSAGDVILWGRVPNGSTLLAIEGGGAASLILDVQETFILDSTLGSINALSRLGDPLLPGLPHTVSLSDDALGSANLSAMLKSVIGTLTSATATGIMSTTFYITRDPGGTPNT